MAKVKVKICGITSYEDAMACVDAGADLLGFNFFTKSPRYIEPEKAHAIIDQMPSSIDTVALFVNPQIDEVKDAAGKGHFNWIQLHGDETQEFIDGLHLYNVRTIKAVRIKEVDDFQKAKLFFTDAILLDAYDPNHYGGTGKKFDWDSLPLINKRIFLAGGINASNAVEAVEMGVYGIDLCSSVESAPGVKDTEKMKEFFEAIKHVRI